MNGKFIKEAVAMSVFLYRKVDLLPESQTFVSVLITPNAGYVTDAERLLERMDADRLVCDYCGRLLALHLEGSGYFEDTWLCPREYDLKKLEDSTFEDFESDRNLTLMRFVLLIKAYLTESRRKGTCFLIETNYLTDETTVITGDSFSEYSLSCEEMENDLCETEEERKELEKEIEELSSQIG